MKHLLRRWLFGSETAVTSAKSQTSGNGELDRKSWKAKFGEANARAKTLEAEVRQQAKRAEKFKAIVHELQQREVEFEKLRERLATAERELAIAREYLMAVEVKLDILEGAANVLDRRTRDAVSPQRQETGAAV